MVLITSVDFVSGFDYDINLGALLLLNFVPDIVKDGLH